MRHGERLTRTAVFRLSDSDYRWLLDQAGAGGTIGGVLRSLIRTDQARDCNTDSEDQGADNVGYEPGVDGVGSTLPPLRSHR